MILSLMIVASLFVSSVSTAHGVQNYSVNATVNPSFENGVSSWIVDTFNDGNVGSSITANSTLSVTGNYSARLDVSGNPTSNNPGTHSPITFGHITLYQTNASTIHFGDLTDRPDNFNLWFFVEPKFTGYSLLELRMKASDTTELDYFYINPSLSNVISFQNQTSGGENNKPVKEVVMPTAPVNQWVHFQRNLKADWTAPMTFLSGPPAPGFNLTETLSQTMLEAYFFMSGTGDVYAETIWMDDIGFYVDSATPPAPINSHYWTSFSFIDNNINPVSNLVKWKLFNSTGSEVTGYSQSYPSLKLEPYFVDVYYPTFTGQTPEPYRIIRHKIINLNTTITVSLEMFLDQQTVPPWGYVAFDSNVNFKVVKENASLLRFEAQGTAGPYLVLVATTQKPILIQRNNDDPSLLQWSYDNTIGIVRITTSTLGNFSLFLTPPILVPNLGFRDLLNNPFQSNIAWRLYNSTGSLIGSTPGQYVPKDNYTLQVYYAGYLIYKTAFDPTTSVLRLQAFPLTGPQTGYVASNSTLKTITVLENTATRLSFKAEGAGPSLVILKIPTRPLSIEKDGTVLSGWTFNSTSSTIALQVSSLGTFTIIYGNTTSFPILYVGVAVGILAVATVGTLVFTRMRSKNPLPSSEEVHTANKEAKSKNKKPRP